MGQPIRLSPGEKFNRLTVIRLSQHNGRRARLCRCDCGAETHVEASRLLSGHVRSCGCYSRELHSSVMRRTMTVHGASRTLQYVAWQLMHDRCINPKNEAYHRYGGRGIRVCERWNDYALFFADMGERPEGLTLDRIDNDGNYEPSNCRWATRKEQMRNVSYNRRITVQGVTKTLAEWAELSGIKREKISWRLRRGWAPERAILRKAA